MSYNGDKRFWQSKKFFAFVFSMLLLAGTLITIAFAGVAGLAYAVTGGIGMLALAAISIVYVHNQRVLDQFIAGLREVGDILDDNDETDSGWDQFSDSHEDLE